jgi:hypothetical protein
MEGIMKKSFVLAAVAAALCLSSSASALNFNNNLRAIRVPSLNIRLSSDGGQIVPLFVGANNTCEYIVEIRSPRNDDDVATCRLSEVRTFGNSCLRAAERDLDTSISSVQGDCYGFTAVGTYVPLRLDLTSFSAGAIRLAGVARLGYGAPLFVTVAR